MTTTPHGQVPEALRLAEALGHSVSPWTGERIMFAEAAAELRRLHAYCQELESQVIRDCMTHVQEPAEIEHVAGDVSKNSAKKNMNDYAELPEPDATTVGLGAVWNRHSMRDFADATHALRARQPAPATQQAREVSDAMVLAALQVQYPATYGQHLRHPADGPKTSIRTEAEIDTARRMVVAALAAAPQPSPTAQAAESVTAAATESYVQPVPDKCDRIVWRGHYYHLPPAQAAESVLEDAARLDFLIEQRAYVVSDPDACAGHWLHWAEPDGSTLVQGDEHPTPRAAIDAAMNKGGAA